MEIMLIVKRMYGRESYFKDLCLFQFKQFNLGLLK